MKKTNLIGYLIILGSITLYITAFAQGTQEIPLIEFREFVANLNRLHQGVYLRFNEITYNVGEKKYAEPFGQMIREKLIKLVGSVSDVSTQSSDSTKMTPYSVEGYYWEDDQRIRLQLLFVPLSEQNKLPTQKVGLLLDRPDSVGVISENTVLDTFKDFADAYNKNSSFSIEVSTTVKVGGELHVGQPFEIHVKSNRDCYFVLMNRDVAGKIESLHPISGESNNVLKAGDVFKLTDVHLTPPFGLEVLFLVASLEPLNVVEARSIFQVYYDKYISKKFRTRAIRRGIAVAWTSLRSIPAKPQE